MDLAKILRAFLVNAYKMTDAEVDSLLQGSETITEDSVIAELTQRDQTRVAELLKPKPGAFKDAYNKAKAEVLTEVETKLKEKYKIETDATGLELIDEVISAQAGTKPGKLSEDEIRKHPIYQTMERDFRKQLKDKDAEMSNKITELETGFKKNEIFSTVSGEALRLLDGLKPVLPGNPAVAGTIRNKFVEEFKGYDFERQPDGKFLVMKDGQVKQNAHGHSLYLDDLVKETAGNYFEFQQNNGGSNSGNGGAADQKNEGSQQSKYPAGITPPKTLDELFKITGDLSIKAEDRTAVLKTWEAEQAGQK